MQKFFAIGNLTRDPDLSQTNSGVSICRFTIAVNRPYAESNGERQADFFNCIAWRSLAESIARYCRKGDKVAVSGYIQIRTYEDNKGNRQTTVDVIVQDAEFLTSPKRESESTAQGSAQQRQSLPKRGQLSLLDDDTPF